MKKSCVLILSLVRIMTCCLFAAFCLAGCADEPETADAKSISKITITDIPVQIPIKDEAGENLTFKVYLNASNTDNANVPPVAKGTALISNGTLNKSNNTYSVTLQLQNPNPISEDDPDYDSGSWSGTARYFSVMISPQRLYGKGVNATWMKASTTALDKGKSTTSWESLLDSRLLANLFVGKPEALYAGITAKDPDIIKD